MDIDNTKYDKGNKTEFILMKNLLTTKGDNYKQMHFSVKCADRKHSQVSTEETVIVIRSHGFLGDICTLLCQMNKRF